MQKTTAKNLPGREFFSSRYTTSVGGNQQQQLQEAQLGTMKWMRAHPTVHEHHTQNQVQSGANSSPSDDMFRIATVVQHLTHLSGAVSEGEKIVAMSKIVLNLVKHNDNQSL